MLSRSHSLFVIARNSSFTYKGRAVDVKQIARELGVRYGRPWRDTPFRIADVRQLTALAEQLFARSQNLRFQTLNSPTRIHEDP
jgi:hypothetical protein